VLCHKNRQKFAEFDVDGSGELSEEELEKVVDWLLDITGEDLEVTTPQRTTHHTTHHASPPHFSTASVFRWVLVHTARGQGLGQASADDEQGSAQQGRRNDHRTRYFFGVVRMYVLCCGFSDAVVCIRRRHADTRLYLPPPLLQRKSSAWN
jgi:hypothetical protein